MNKAEAQIEAGRILESLSTDGHTIKIVNEVFKTVNDPNPSFYEVIADVHSITQPPREYIVAFDSDGELVESDYVSQVRNYEPSNYVGSDF